MKNKLWAKGIVIGIIVLFFGTSVSVVPIIKADPIAWDVTLYFTNPGGQNDYVMFGEAPDARDGPPADTYDIVKPPAPMVPYIRAYLKDNLPIPYTNLWKDYRQYPDSAKVWNLSVKWEPEDGESPTTITISWSTAEVDDSEYTTVSLCTDAGVILQNMLVNNTYTFSCPASVLQNFKIICLTSTLTLTKSGTGSGTIQASPSGPYYNGTTVTIWANASTGSTFAGFTGSLTGTTTPQILVMTGNKTVDAGFTLNGPYTLTLTKNGTGSGTIQASPSGPYYYGASVTIWANASTGSTFAGFTGALSGTTTPQILVVDGNKTVDATFTQNHPPNTPMNPSPTNGSTGIDINPTLSIYVTDLDGDSMTVRFYNAGNNNLIGFKSMVMNGTITSVIWSGLNYDTIYQWYAVANDSYLQNKSNNWSFTTKSSDGGGGGGGGAPPTQNQKPVADLSAGEPYQGFVNTEITFNGSKSHDPDGNITKWFWVFGDNMNGTGKTVRHTYSKAGTYTVTLTVTDNKGATNIDTTTCVITQPNRPPTNPFITGPTDGTKNTMYTYTALSTDADKDTIQYTIDWGDLVSQSSGFLPNATNYTVNHSWAAAGRYSVTITVTDNQTESFSKINVYIDAVQTGEIGYLFDNDGDGIYDAFYSDELKQTMTIQKKDDSYNIDSDGDGDLDYTYNETNGLTPYQNPSKTPGFEPVFLICIIIAAVICGIIVAVLLWKKLYI